MWTYECEFKVQRPTTMTSACADFGEQVHSIKWTVWEKGKALGTGVYSKNDCDPDCADGTIYETPVKVELRDLTRDGNEYYLNTFTFTYTYIRSYIRRFKLTWITINKLKSKRCFFM